MIVPALLQHQVLKVLQLLLVKLPCCQGAVPQLLPNFTGPKLPNPETVPCDVARLKCAFRSGCGLALQNYALGCLDLVQGKSHICNNHCRHSLIALVSTTEGKRLMKVKIKILLVILFC